MGLYAVCEEKLDNHWQDRALRHPGIDRTTASIAHSFHWPGLYADVAHFLRSCPTCAA